jgi:hypothetical protein
MSKLSVRRGSKKHQALLALLEVAKKRSVVTFEELISEMSALGLSKPYTEGLVKELAAFGILKRVRGRGLRDRRRGLGEGVEGCEGCRVVVIASGHRLRFYRHLLKPSPTL